MNRFSDIPSAAILVVGVLFRMASRFFGWNPMLMDELATWSLALGTLLALIHLTGLRKIKLHFGITALAVVTFGLSIAATQLGMPSEWRFGLIIPPALFAFKTFRGIPIYLYDPAMVLWSFLLLKG